MEQLKTAILKQGRIVNGNILKVDRFLNHQIDPLLMQMIGQEFAKHFQNKGITKILTIESSGIAPAMMTALELHVPLVFVKKAIPSTMDNPLTTKVFSFTKNREYDLTIARAMIDDNDKILFIDDFLANGEAFKAIERLIGQTKATIDGVGIVIDKVFQKGHQYVVDKDYDLCSLALIAKLENGQIVFK